MSRLLCLAAFLAVATTSARADVACVQDVLQLHGYDPGPVDGILGRRTAEMAAGFAADQGMTDLPRLTTATSPQWCAALQLRKKGAGGPPLDPALTETGAPPGGPRHCTPNPPPGYARTITGLVDGDPLTIRVSSRFGGAVGSLTWRGKEFINIYDHGRQISYAWHLDGWGECANPTEPGSAADLFSQSSTSVLQSVCSDGPNQLTTRTQPAFWLRPGETGFCDRGATQAKNTELRANQILEKSITIGYRGLANVIAFDAAITLEKDYTSLQTEMPTGYLTHEFTARYRFNPLTGALTEPPGDPLVRPWSFNHFGTLPPILATPDGRYAMGAYTDAPILGYELLFYDVANPWDRTNKWNIVIREEPAPAGIHRYLSFAIVGTLADVQTAMAALYRLHPTDFSPPEGYVDVANCHEIAGWAWDPKAPDRPATIDIFDVADDGTRSLLLSLPANRFREDLPPVLGDNGKHGYWLNTDRVITDTLPHRLQIEAHNSIEGLPGARLLPAEVRLQCP